MGYSGASQARSGDLVVRRFNQDTDKHGKHGSHLNQKTTYDELSF